jgi:hypothetical protein
MFKMPYFGQWVTVVGPKFVDEIARAPESILSFRKHFNDVSRSIEAFDSIKVSSKSSSNTSSAENSLMIKSIWP